MCFCESETEVADLIVKFTSEVADLGLPLRPSFGHLGCQSRQHHACALHWALKKYEQIDVNHYTLTRPREVAAHRGHICHAHLSAPQTKLADELLCKSESFDLGRWHRKLKRADELLCKSELTNLGRRHRKQKELASFFAKAKFLISGVGTANKES